MKLHLRDTAGYVDALQRLSDRGDDDLDAVAPVVQAILHAVRTRGDEALREYADLYDGGAPATMEHGPEALAAAVAQVEPGLVAVLRTAAERIRAYHQRQCDVDVRYTDGDGVSLGWRLRPIARAGVYAPGGKARYPSSVLMSAVPAAVAGVREVIVATPRPTPEILAAAHIAGVSRVFDVGGAHMGEFVDDAT